MGTLFSKEFNPETDVGDLSGKVIIVTGGNTGIGYATVRHLVKRGAKVYLAARNEEKARGAIEKLAVEDKIGVVSEGVSEGEGGRGGEAIWLELDLSDPRKAKKAAEEFLKKEKRLDILVNNAAVTLGPYAVSQDGIQDVMMVNHFGPFVFTQTLLPLLKTTAKETNSDVRIVNVSSNAIKILGNGVRFRNKEDLNDEHAKAWIPPLARYGRTKLANVLYTKELQRRLDEESVPIIVISLHPGTVNTDGNQSFAKKKGGVIGAVYGWWANHFFAVPDAGALNSVFAAVAPTVRSNPEKYKGSFLQPTGVISTPSKDALSVDLARELWGTTESVLKEIGVEV